MVVVHVSLRRMRHIKHFIHFWREEFCLLLLFAILSTDASCVNFCPLDFISARINGNTECLQVLENNTELLCQILLSQPDGSASLSPISEIKA